LGNDEISDKENPQGERKITKKIAKEAFLWWFDNLTQNLTFISLDILLTKYQIIKRFY